ncbi:MAG: hypothetical protein Q9204_004876 [Flavoplaca sp. TL-2023a]
MPFTASFVCRGGLPPETLLAIAGYLDNPTDYVHLSRSHSSISRTLHDREVLAKTIGRVAEHSKECRLLASRQAEPIDALLRIYNRQQAWSEAEPTSTLLLGDGQSFVYRQGLVAYSRDDLIRILDVHSAQHTEGVIYTSLIASQLLGVDCKDSEVELLHLDHGLLTLIYRGETHTVGWTSWILVIDVTQYEQLVLAVDLWTFEDVLVRNDCQHVCIIAPTGLSASGRHRQWVCRLWDTKNPAAKPATLEIPELSINEVGQGLVFEVFDGFLYAVSTQSSHEIEEPEWESHYTCFRFPLNNPSKMSLESIRIWRRDHREGPINDLWTDLQLVRDESTGELTIIEARKEWTAGSSTQRRTWYRQRLPAVFSDPSDIDGKDQDMVDSNVRTDSTQAVSQSESVTTSSTMTDSPHLWTVPPGNREPGQSVPERLSCNVHMEYSPSVPSPATVLSSSLANTKYRTYIDSAATFVDLVVDDQKASSHIAQVQQLRLRIGSRQEVSTHHELKIFHQSIQPQYESKGIRLWPPADAPTVLQDFLQGSIGRCSSSDILSSSFQSIGDIIAIADERSILYLIKEKASAGYEKGKLILINFDQDIRFWHETWVPDFIHLYGCEQKPSNAVHEPTAQVVMKRTYESTRMDIDEAENIANDNGRYYDNDWNKYQEEQFLEPADEINHLFWCEQFDDDEPVNLHWFQEQMALWTDFRQGFCFA